jgi:hypothetical protein
MNVLREGTRGISDIGFNNRALKQSPVVPAETSKLWIGPLQTKETLCHLHASSYIISLDWGFEERSYALVLGWNRSQRQIRDWKHARGTNFVMNHQKKGVNHGDSQLKKQD